MKSWERKWPIRIKEYLLVLAITVNLAPLHLFRVVMAGARKKGIFVTGSSGLVGIPIPSVFPRAGIHGLQFGYNQHAVFFSARKENSRSILERLRSNAQIYGARAGHVQLDKRKSSLPGGNARYESVPGYGVVGSSVRA